MTTTATAMMKRQSYKSRSMWDRVARQMRFWLGRHTWMKLSLQVNVNSDAQHVRMMRLIGASCRLIEAAATPTTHTYTDGKTSCKTNEPHVVISDLLTSKRMCMGVSHAHTCIHTSDNVH